MRFLALMEVMEREKLKATRKFPTYMILKLRILQPEIEKSEGRHHLRKMSNFYLQHIESEMTACSGKSRVP